MRLRQWLFLLFALVVGGVCIRLGFWQLDRLEERRAQNEAIRAGLAEASIPLDQAIDSGALNDYQRVSAEGTLDPEGEILLSPRSRDGQPGVHLVTPLLLSDRESAILVERGWIPFDQRLLPERRRYVLRGEVKISGFLKPGVEQPSILFLRGSPSEEGDKLQWQTLDLAAIEDQLDYPILDCVLVQTEPIAAETPQPIPQPDLDLSEGPHLGYAIQWFSFAAIAIGGISYWLWRQQQEPV